LKVNYEWKVVYFCTLSGSRGFPAHFGRQYVLSVDLFRFLWPRVEWTESCAYLCSRPWQYNTRDTKK